MPKYEWSDDGYFVTETRDLREIRRVLVITMLLNFSAMGVKLAAGYLTGALSIVADGLDSLFDGLSNVVGLAGLYAASRPPDAEHPYGHRKFETVAALSIAFLLFLTCWQLLQVAWGRLGEGIAPLVGVGAAAAMLISILIQAGTSYYELRAGRRLKSELLVADALHTRASILVSASVLAGLGFVRLGFPKADPILAIFVSVMIAKIGIDVLRETLPVLLDQAPVDPKKIADVVSAIGGVESFHRVRSRGAEGSAAVDLHIRISPRKTVQEADAIANEVRRRILDMEDVSDVTVHIEAQHYLSSNASDMIATLKQAASEFGLTVHESWVHRMEDDLYLEMHVGVDPRLTLGQAHSLVDRLENELHKRLPEIKEFHSHIEMASSNVLEGDRAPKEIEDLVRKEVENLIAEIPAVADPHNLIVRRDPGGKDSYYISLECTMAGETPVAEAHLLSDRIEHELSHRLSGVVDVFVHLEPPDQV